MLVAKGDEVAYIIIENSVLYPSGNPNNHKPMFVELPKDLILFSAAAFLLGWILSSIVSRLGARHRATKRDPRDDRIRSLEAELRIAQGNATTANGKVEKLTLELEEAQESIERRDNVITEQQKKAEKLSNDLKESVLKTRELRAELADRATENVHAEAKIREVETELSVAQASTDLIATGILDYSLDSENEDDEDEAGRGGAVNSAT
jgi:uncharacterized protein (DUF3084 family)